MSAVESVCCVACTEGSRQLILCLVRPALRVRVYFTKEHVDFLAALLTPLLAIIATYIAYQQHRTNRLKVQSDLYERRLRIYEGLAELLAHVCAHADVGDEELRLFSQKTRESWFLFGAEIPKYLDTVFRSAVDVKTKCQLLNAPNMPVGPERTKLAEGRAELLKWFGDQFDVSRARFGRYLTLR